LEDNMAIDKDATPRGEVADTDEDSDNETEEGPQEGGKADEKHSNESVKVDTSAY